MTKPHRPEVTTSFEARPVGGRWRAVVKARATGGEGATSADAYLSGLMQLRDHLAAMIERRLANGQGLTSTDNNQAPRGS